jgi:hypothetical protein
MTSPAARVAFNDLESDVCGIQYQLVSSLTKFDGMLWSISQGNREFAMFPTTKSRM